MPAHTGSIRIDPRRPLAVDLRQLDRRPGSMRRMGGQVAAPADLRIDLVGVPAGAQADLDLRLESVVEGVFVSGTVSVPLTGDCGRCLTPLRQALTVDLQELFAYPDSTTVETTDEDEIRRIDGDRLDLLPAVRDAVILALPLSPLCRPDCLGLCDVCGERWQDLPPDHGHETIDPRWAALAERLTADDAATPERRSS